MQARSGTGRSLRILFYGLVPDGARLRTAIRLPYFFVMFIGLLLSWQRPECNRDFRSW
jgi:hypothetical protein